MSQSSLRLVESSSMDKDKSSSRRRALPDRARLGKGSIMRLGKSQKPLEIETISTGSLGLDIALGVGGLPRGRVIEIYGPESSGKTTLALHTVAEAQREGGVCAFVDAEHALDPIYARKLGVNLDDLLISQPDTGSRRSRSPTRWCAPAPSTCWSSTCRGAHAQGGARRRDGRGPAGLQARLMSQALRSSRVRSRVLEHDGDLHQPDPHEDRRHVRKPRDHDGRQRAEVLCLGPPRHPPRLDPEGAGRRHRQQRPRQGREEQGRPTLQAGGIRHHVRRGHLESGRASSISASRPASSRNRAPGSPTTASASARAARIRSSSSGTIGRSPTGSKAPSARTPACSPTASWTMRPPPLKTSTRASHRDLPPSRQTESRRGRPRRLFVPQPIIVGIMASSSGERSETRGISGRVGRLCLRSILGSPPRSVRG